MQELQERYKRKLKTERERKEADAFMTYPEGFASRRHAEFKKGAFKAAKDSQSASALRLSSAAGLGFVFKEENKREWDEEEMAAAAQHEMQLQEWREEYKSVTLHVRAVTDRKMLDEATSAAQSLRRESNNFRDDLCDVDHELEQELRKAQQLVMSLNESKRNKRPREDLQMQELFNEQPGEEDDEEHCQELQNIEDEHEREEGQPMRKKMKVESSDDGESKSSGDENSDNNNVEVEQPKGREIADLFALADEAEKEPDDVAAAEGVAEAEKMDTEPDTKTKSVSESEDSEFDPDAPDTDEGDDDEEEEDDNGSTLREPANSDEELADLNDEHGVDERAEARLLAKGDVFDQDQLGEGSESEEEDTHDPSFEATDGQIAREEKETQRQAVMDTLADERENGPSRDLYAGINSKKTASLKRRLQKGAKGPLFTSNMQPINEGDEA
jgi:hypothetical protein